MPPKGLACAGTHLHSLFQQAYRPWISALAGLYDFTSRLLLTAHYARQLAAARLGSGSAALQLDHQWSGRPLLVLCQCSTDHGEAKISEHFQMRTDCNSNPLPKWVAIARSCTICPLYQPLSLLQIRLSRVIMVRSVDELDISQVHFVVMYGVDLERRLKGLWDAFG